MSLKERKSFSFKMAEIHTHDIAVFHLGNSAKMQQNQENDFVVGTRNTCYASRNFTEMKRNKCGTILFEFSCEIFSHSSNGFSCCDTLSTIFTV